MARTKKIELPKEEIKKPSRKKAAPEKPVQDPVNELCTVFKAGDNIQLIAKELTGDIHKVYKMLEYSGVGMHEIKEGTILKWRV